MNNNDSARSLPSGATGARISEPTKPAPRSEGTPAPTGPKYAGHARHGDELPPSTRPNLLPGLSSVSKVITQTLRNEEIKQRELVADAFGLEDGPRRDAARLDAAVRANEITAAEAEKIFTALHPTVRPQDLQDGSQS